MTRFTAAGTALLWMSAGCSLAVGIDDECETTRDCPDLSTCTSGLCVSLPAAGVCTTRPDCNAGEVCAGGECLVLPRESVIGSIDANTTWTNDRVYVLEDTIYVSRDVVLTVEAGTQVIAGVPRAALIVDHGRLDVRGTLEAPVVFTSARPTGTRAPGDWGGIALVGDAPVNAETEAGRILEGIEPPLVYGGDDLDHNCGTITFLRVEFAGFILAANQELNGLTLAGCGRDTLVDYVQVHRGNDDGIELFGGAANIRHAVITDPADDGLDWDQGWQGRAQFVIVRQSDADKNGIEADNNVDDPDLLPRSSPLVFNLTVIGTNDPSHPTGATNDVSIGATLRRGTAGTIANAIFTNQGAFPFVISGEDSQECALADTEPALGTECALDGASSTALRLEAAVFHQSLGRSLGSLFPMAEDGAEAEFVHETWTSSVGVVFDIGQRDLLVDPFAQLSARPLFSLQPSVRTSIIDGVVPPNEEFFDRGASFVGAIEDRDRDWTEGWTAYPED